MEPILLRADRAGERADQLLARLGAPERMRARSVDIQVFLSFFLPLALALVHAAVGMTAANAVIAEVGKVDAAASSAVAAVLLLVIYGGYFLATCWAAGSCGAAEKCEKMLEIGGEMCYDRIHV